MISEELIRDRRTIHDYKKIKVDWDIVKKSLDLSLWSLNHKLTFPWVYIRTGANARGKIADLMVEIKEENKGRLSDVMRESIRSKALNSSELIILGQKRSNSEFQQKEDYATLACSIQIASLYLWDKGIGSKWSTGGFTQSNKLFEILNIKESEVEVIGALYVGIAERTPKTPERPPLKEFLIEVS